MIFLHQLDKNEVVEEFDDLFNHYDNIIYKTSVLDGKNSTTGWHTDMDDLSYLYVVKGKKKIHLAQTQ